MKIIWRTWGDKDGEDIEKQVTSVLDSYRKQADDVLKELGTLEKTLEKRKKELNDEVKKCTEWINPSNKKSIIHQLPDEIKENITVEITEEPEDLFVTLGDLVTDLTKDDTLSDRIGELKSKQNNLIMGQEHLEGDTCIYCDSDVDTKELDKKIDALSSEIDTVDSAIETKDSLRGDTEKLKRGLGENIKQFTEVVQKYKNSLDKLVTAKKITKQQANEKLKNFGID
jgi:transcription initiation factor IIE alpha subunit